MLPSLTALIPLLAILGSVQAAPTCRRKTDTASATATQDATTSHLGAVAAASTITMTSTAKTTMTTHAQAETGVSQEAASAVETTAVVTNTVDSSTTESKTSDTVNTSSAQAPSTDTTEEAIEPTTTTAKAPSTVVQPTTTEAATTTQVAAEQPTTTQTSTTEEAHNPSSTKTSASAAASTTAASGKKTKMGVGWPIQDQDAAPVAEFFTADSTVSWWCNWNKNWNQGLMKSDGVTISGSFVPMLFNTEFMDNSDTFQDGFTTIMGYNEPDLQTDTGVSAYTAPAEAAAAWKTQIVSLRSTYPSVKVISPAMASNQDWLAQFFTAICPDGTAANGYGDCQYKPDYVAMHVYTTNADGFKESVQAFHDKFGLPVVVNEYACYNFGGDNADKSVAEVSDFMAATTSWMDQQDWIIQYAWFGTARDSAYLYGVAESNRLMDTSGKLTALGKQYMNGGKA
ncbi:hypothetical protein IAT38_002426 [Cryptococcus sp. DSM 104549]